MATCVTFSSASSSGKKVALIAARLPFSTFTFVSSRGSYQMAGMRMVSPWNARRMRSRTPRFAAISSRRTLYSGGGSLPKRSMNAWFTRMDLPLAS